MAGGTTLVLALLMQAPVPVSQQAPLPVSQQADASTIAPVDVAFEELSEGNNSAAIKRIEQNAELQNDDPARLINLGIAHARQGSEREARAMFTAAAQTDTRYRLETAQGEWIDSRVLARRALAMLDRGEFRANGRVAAR